MQHRVFSDAYTFNYINRAGSMSVKEREMLSTRISINLQCCSPKLFRSSDFAQGHAVNSVWDYSFGCPFPSIFSNSWR